MHVPHLLCCYGEGILVGLVVSKQFGQRRRADGQTVGRKQRSEQEPFSDWKWIEGSSAIGSSAASIVMESPRGFDPSRCIWIICLQSHHEKSFVFCIPDFHLTMEPNNNFGIVPSSSLGCLLNVRHEKPTSNWRKKPTSNCHIFQDTLLVRLCLLN